MTTRRLGLWVVVALAAVAAYVSVGPVVDRLATAVVSDRQRPTVTSGDASTPPDAALWTTVQDLAGAWDFRIGDRPEWIADSAITGWDRVFVPAAWEDEGYYGYDGFAWYRKTFTLDEAAAQAVGDAPPSLHLGRIDDADEVWLNGVSLGREGRMPPVYQTATFRFRTYPIPPGLLRLDRPNVLTVRVYDAGLEGGILEGPVALAVPTDRNPDAVPMVANLAGDWQFSPGDDPAWAAPGYDDGAWATLRVPGVWETQGFAGTDGYAWYRTTVSLDTTAAARDLILVLGAVDDLDETFVNGVRVGATGDVEGREVRGDEWLIERAYSVPARVLRAGPNVVAVRVYDGLVDGGLHRGPVALLTPEAHAERERRRARDD